MYREPQYPACGAHHIFCLCRNRSRIYRDHFYSICRHDSPLSVLFCCSPSQRCFRPQDHCFPQRRLRECYDPTASPALPVTPAPYTVPSGLRFPQRYSGSGSCNGSLPAGPTAMHFSWHRRIPPRYHPILSPRPILPRVPFRGISLLITPRFHIESRIYVFHVRYHHTEADVSLQNLQNTTVFPPDPDDRQSRYPTLQLQQVMCSTAHHIIVPVPVPVLLPAA